MFKKKNKSNSYVLSTHMRFSNSEALTKQKVFFSIPWIVV